MPMMTVHCIIKRYLRDDKVVHKRQHLNSGRRPKLTPEIQEYIARKETLQEWVNFGLKERTQKIFERFGV